MGLTRLLFFGAIALLVYILYKRVIAGPLRARQEREEEERLGRLVQDPQCHVYVDSREAVRRKVPGGELYFCSRACAKAYLKAHPGA
jgi:YHS domain-containing protein